MKIERAIEILELHNKWRRDNYGTYEMTTPKEIGMAIDTVVINFRATTSITSQDAKSAEEWLKKHHYVDSYMEWNPLPSPNEGMMVSISSVIEQFASQQSDEWVKVEDGLPERNAPKYFIGDENNDPGSIAYVNEHDRIIDNSNSQDITKWCRYWRELPQPPK